ncbi:MAG: TonB-dependent receptor [Bacteroidota bacterium]
MKKNIIWTIKMVTLYSFLGLILQGILVNLLFASTPSKGQNLREVKVSVNAVSITFEQALQLIEKKTNFRFIFFEKNIPLHEKVTVSVEDESLYNILEVFAKDYGLTFNRINDQIVVRKSHDQTENLTTTIENGKVKGKVTDAKTGEPLIGASVILKPLNIGAATDIEGNYSFDVPTEVAKGQQAELVASFINYKKKSVMVTLSGADITENFDLEEDLLKMNEVVVTGTRAAQEVGNIPAAVSVVTDLEVRQGQQTTNINEALKRVPGVAMRVHLEGSTRATASIRGAGAQSTFGARGVRILVNGIPKNNAGGSGQDFINIDLASVARVEVVRGPSSALYGNQAGGVINFIMEEGSAIPFIEYRQTLGSFGLAKEHLKASGQSGPFSYFASIYRTDQSGYRDFSKFFGTGFQTLFRYRFEDGGSVMTMLSYEKLRQWIPGSITAEEVAANPRQANPALAAAGGVQGSIDEFRAAVNYTRPLFGKDQIELTGYYIPRPIYFTISAPIRNSQFFINRGVNLRYLLLQPIAGRENRLTVGFDYQNTPLSNAIFSLTTGAALQQLEENLSSTGFYLQDEFNLFPEFLLNLGGRLDEISFGFENLMRPGLPGSSFIQKYERFTPKLGAVYHVRPNVSLYVNYSQGLEAPISEQLRNSPFSTGEFVLNQNLKPMTLRSYEVGAKGQVSTWMSFELAYYRQNIEDFIVTRQILRPDGRTTFTASLNAAEVKQQGLELGVFLVPSSGVTASITYTFSDYTFSRFSALGETLTGKRLAGIPQHDIFGELRYRHSSGLYSFVNLKSVSSFFLNDANAFSNAAYNVVNLSFGHERIELGSLRLAPFITINNLFNEAYTSLAEVNNAARRFFNPMPGRNVVAGVTLGF